MLIDHEFVTVEKLQSLYEEAKEEDNPLQKRIGEILNDVKAYIKQRENYSLLYLLSSAKITRNKEAIKSLLAYLEAEDK
ncbi:MAG: hypothetical protein LGR52_07045 [Candidatus Thiosymbion ectosymbiont of Robbea hypermnestra]|nr:hypothetical protein [Candidatus Thiosymbion ectosymbiont of Robbea hypermnestra]